MRDQQAYYSKNLDITSTNLTDLSISSISSLLGRWMAAACQGQRLREVVAGSHRLFLNGFCTGSSLLGCRRQGQVRAVAGSGSSEVGDVAAGSISGRWPGKSLGGARHGRRQFFLGEATRKGLAPPAGRGHRRATPSGRHARYHRRWGCGGGAAARRPSRRAGRSILRGGGAALEVE